MAGKKTKTDLLRTMCEKQHVGDVEDLKRHDERLNDLFNTDYYDRMNAENRVVNVPICKLHDFKNHPYRVVEDDEMRKLADSIKETGVLEPGIVRRIAGMDDEYEVIAGHRRKYASSMAGLNEVPVLIKDYDDYQATIIMVDSNIQRENIRHSEKARAYKMKYDALKHQGKAVGDGGSTLAMVGEVAGDSKNQVQRYIYLSRLSDELLVLVDNGILGFTQGVEISSLTEEEQKWVFDIISKTNVRVSGKQALELKTASKNQDLSPTLVKNILLQETKVKDKKEQPIKHKELAKYFPKNYSPADMRKVLFELLEDWKNRQQKENQTI